MAVTVPCTCGAKLELPPLDDVGDERVLLCPKCRLRTRVARRADGKIDAARLPRPEVAVRCPCGAAFVAVPPDEGGTVRCPTCGQAFDVKKETRPAAAPTPRPAPAPAPKPAAAARPVISPKPVAAVAGPAPAAPSGPAPIVGVSALLGRNQDRAAWHGAERVACVADGLTTSPRSAEAADVVCREAPKLFAGADPAEGLRALAARLLALRAEILVRPLGADELAAASGDAKAAGAARMTAYQTTAAAFKVEDRGRERRVGFITCGGSAVLVLEAGGAAVVSGLHGTREDGAPVGASGKGPAHVTFPPRPAGTFCLPEGVSRAEAGSTTVATSSWVVAGSDGFFCAFTGSRELLAWLETNRRTLGDATKRAALLADLHTRLEAIAGADDDIAFVALPPA